MSEKTASGLVEYAKAQLGNPYWYGGFGQIATQSLLDMYRSMYPDQYKATNFTSQFGSRVYDCVGLIKGYRWSKTPFSAPVYNASQDVNVKGMWSLCSNARGALSSTTRLEPGTLLFMRDLTHVGVYIGAGKEIEARGHAYGVVEYDYASRGWYYWGKPNWIEYNQDSSITSKYNEPFNQLGTADQSYISKMPMISMYSKNVYVTILQVFLNLYGKENLDIDGDFGALTKAGLMRWQTKHNLEVDGICGKQSWASFFVK